MQIIFWFFCCLLFQDWPFVNPFWKPLLSVIRFRHKSKTRRRISIKERTEGVAAAHQYVIDWLREPCFISPMCCFPLPYHPTAYTSVPFLNIRMVFTKSAHTDWQPQGKKWHQDNIRLTRYEHPRNRVLNRASAQSHLCTDATHQTRPLVYHTKNEHNNGYPNDTGDVQFTWSTIRLASRGCFCQI